MKEDETLTVADVELAEREGRLMVWIVVRNDSERTVHAYATARKINYDPGERELELELNDENPAPIGSASTRALPRFAAVEPGAEQAIELSLPPVMRKMAAEVEEGSIVFEELPVHEAERVKVNVAWSDTPFYPDVREGGKGGPNQLRDWRKGVAGAEVRVRRPRSDGTELGT